METPSKDCTLCPRLCEFRTQNAKKFPTYYNGPVPPFTSPHPKLLIVGLAPGLHGANNTGRPFTADYAGDLLYPTLVKFGFARGEYKERADDGMELIGTRITNAVRCVPPENKPTPAEIKTCNNFLISEIAALASELRVMVALGQIAHQAILRALNVKVSAMPFGHNTKYQIPLPPRGGGSGEAGGEGEKITLLSSYHCSRYNTNTKRLTPEMFETVFAHARELCDK